MGSETIYRKALENLNSIHNGDDSFEKICHILVKSLLPTCSFLQPSGGKGRQDGGRDGMDHVNNVRMSCSIEKKFSTKIKEEVLKKGQEVKLIYFSNQIISEPEKIKFEQKYKSELELIVFSLEDLSREIESYFLVTNNPELYELLRLSFLKNGERINRGDAKAVGIKISPEDIYLKKIIIEQEKNIINFPASMNPLRDFVFSELTQCTVNDYRHILLKGIGNIGKTTMMKQTYNSIIEEFSKKNLNESFIFCPFPYFIDLKNYCGRLLEIVSSSDPIMLFLDGLDELSEYNKVALIKELRNIIQNNPNIIVVLSGRDAAFITNITNTFDNNYSILRIQKYCDDNDFELITLLREYEGTPVSDLIPLPIFRDFAKRYHGEKIISNNVFYNELILYRLQEDKKRYDEACNISVRMSSGSKIQLDIIINKLCEFSFFLFINERKIFTEKEFDQVINESDMCVFLLQSSLIDYLDEDHISFSVNYYYEYFVAKYYFNKKKAAISKVFFLKGSCDINIKTINIFTIYLSMIEKNSVFYKRCIGRLKKIDSAYILLTDYEGLSEKERYICYCDIILQRNIEKIYIYYGRFKPTSDMLVNIQSLAKALTALLPEAYYSDAVKTHTEVIIKYLKNPIVEDLVIFTNAIILLGVYCQPIWDTEQQQIIKNICLPLLKFFKRNELAKKLHGLLSDEVILDWYVTYQWTAGWRDSEWNIFLQGVLPNCPEIECTICTKSEFEIKLKVYNRFYKDEVIKRMKKALIFYFLRESCETASIQGMSLVPEKLGDEYQSPVIQFNDDVFIFNTRIKQEDVSVDDLIEIFSFVADCEVRYESTSEFDLSGIYHILVNKFIEKIPEINEAHNIVFYKIFTYLTRFDIYILNNIELLNQICDDVKIFLVEEIYQDLLTDSLNKSYFFDKLLYPLLNIHDQGRARCLLNIFKNEKSIGLFKSIVSYLNSNILPQHILYADGQIYYQEYFVQEIQYELKKHSCLKDLELNKNIMIQRESQIINDFEHLNEEIHKVLNFIDSELSFQVDGTEFIKLHNLDADQIKSSISFNNLSFCPPVFSDFVIKLLRSFAFDTVEKKINRSSLEKYINHYFNDTNYWIFFYMHYVSEYPLDKTLNFLSNNQDITNRIEISMRTDVTRLLEIQSEYDFSEGRNRGWVAPFVNYLSILFDDKLPGWMDKRYGLKFCLFPGFCFSTTGVSFVSGAFKWRGYESTFQWIEEIFGLEKRLLIVECLRLLENLPDGYSRAQIMKYLIQNINVDSLLKMQIEKIIICESKRNGTEFVNTSLIYVLDDFWNHCEYNYLVEYPDLWDVSLLARDCSPCAKHILTYICRVADYKEREKIIQSLKYCMFDDVFLSFLAQLGYDKAISSKIDSYLKGKNFDLLHENDNEFGFHKKSKKLLLKYIQLFEYAIEKNNDRRQSLVNSAQNGIKRHLDEKYFPVFFRELNKIIQRRKNNDMFTSYIEDYINEMKQFVFVASLKVDSIDTKNFIRVVFLGFTSLILFAVTFFFWSKMQEVIKVLSILFTLITGFASLLPFLGINNFNALKVKIKRFFYFTHK